MQIGGRQETPAYLLNTLKPGHVVEGPAILIDDISTVVVEPECTAYITAGQDIRIEVFYVPTSPPSLVSAEKIEGSCTCLLCALISHEDCTNSAQVDHQTRIHPYTLYLRCQF